MPSDEPPAFYNIRVVTVTLQVRNACPEDLQGILDIYNREILDGFAHFGTEPMTLTELRQSFEEAGNLPWMVASHAEQVVGFARATAWKSRGGYRHTCEVGVYARPEFHGQGIGRRLYEAMLPELQARGFKTILAGVALPNEASIRLHERFGFQPVGVLPKVGWKGGEWRDVGYWALTFDTPECGKD